MQIRKRGNSYQVDHYTDGQRVRRQFAKRSEAQAYIEAKQTPAPVQVKNGERGGRKPSQNSSSQSTKTPTRATAAKPSKRVGQQLRCAEAAGRTQ